MKGYIYLTALRNTDPNGEESVAPGLWLRCTHRQKRGRKKEKEKGEKRANFGGHDHRPTCPSEASPTKVTTFRNSIIPLKYSLKPTTIQETFHTLITMPTYWCLLNKCPLTWHFETWWEMIGSKRENRVLWHCLHTKHNLRHMDTS